MSGLVLVSLIFGFLIVHALVPGMVAGQRDSAGEYELKAAMLYNLTNFVDWPDSAYPDPRLSLHLCVLGKDPFGNALTFTVSNKPASVKPVSIRYLQSDREFGGCHILYISSSERGSATQIFSTVNGSGVLTVGEMTQFAAHGGMIQFSLEDRRVRFDINLDAASRSGLRISSKLLALAHVVRN
jgi:hypothetical protein